MTVDGKEKELAAVGISVATGCKPCTDFHVEAARKAGASDREIERAMVVALSIRQRATDVMEAYAIKHVGGSPDASPPADEGGKGNRLDELVAIGSAFGVNCVSTLEHHLQSASEAGISEAEVTLIARLAMYIKKRASWHVERLCNVAEKSVREA
jgi:AhpD family alkylhydroperoxidase